MDNLSNELIDLIIQHVDRRDLSECALINRQCHTVTNPILWRQLVIADERTFDVLQQTLTLHTDYGHYIQKAQFGPRTLTDASLSTFTRRTPNLITLEMDCALDLTEVGLAPLVHNCPHLGSIRFASCVMSSMKVLDQCHSLRQLEFWSCFDLGHRLFVSLPTSLTSLKIQLCHTIDINTIIEVLARFYQLTTLVLVEWGYDLSGCLKMTWPHLRCLKLQDCPGLTDATAIAFIRRHPQLLSLEWYDGIFTNATLDAIATYLPGILHLGVHHNINITAHGVRRLIQRCTNLKELELDDVYISMDDFPELMDRQAGYLYHLDRHDIATIQLNALN